MDMWEKIVPAFKYNKEVPFFEMLVPTVDTVRFGYLLEKLLAVRYPVLYTGGTGVGKVRPIHKLSKKKYFTYCDSVGSHQEPNCQVSEYFF